MKISLGTPWKPSFYPEILVVVLLLDSVHGPLCFSVFAHSQMVSLVLSTLNIIPKIVFFAWASLKVSHIVYGTLHWLNLLQFNLYMYFLTLTPIHLLKNSFSQKKKKNHSSMMNPKFVSLAFISLQRSWFIHLIMYLIFGWLFRHFKFMMIKHTILFYFNPEQGNR